VTGTNGPQLVLTSLKEGTDNVMRLSGLTGTDAGNFNFDPLAPAVGTFSETAAGGRTASNAAFELNGITGTSSTNAVTGVLDGVTLNLIKTNVGTPTTVTVSQNTTTGLTSALQAFVKAYNDSNSTMGGLGTYNATTKIAGALQGESSLRTAQGQVRSLLFGTTGDSASAYQRLSDIGVSVAKDGTLSLDTTKLNTAITSDFTGVANLVAKIGDTYNKTLEGIVGTTGSLVSATTGVTRMIKDLTNRQNVLSDRLTRIEASYRKQFTALDTLIASMNKTSTYLTQQLANLPGFTSTSKN
jgi:flagellar hook-associated protein 2